MERVENRILSIRGQRVMLDADLAVLYGILNSPRAVQANIAIMRAFVRMRDAIRGLMQPPGKPRRRIGF